MSFVGHWRMCVLIDDDRWGNPVGWWEMQWEGAVLGGDDPMRWTARLDNRDAKRVGPSSCVLRLQQWLLFCNVALLEVPSVVPH